MKTYIDKLKTKDRVEYETKNYYTSYVDFVVGMPLGSINVFDKRNPDKFLLHATTEEALTLEELKRFAKKYEKERRNFEKCVSKMLEEE